MYSPIVYRQLATSTVLFSVIAFIQEMKTTAEHSPGVFEKIQHFNIEVMVGDTAYKTPAIAKLLKEHGIALLSTYSRPKTKDGFFPKYEYVYDEYFDCYLCPTNAILSYSTTNRDGYREYKSDPQICKHCPYLNQRTQSQAHVKVVT